MIMSATPATPRMIGSAHEERRFTVPESSRPTDAPLSRALALSADALAAEPAGLLTDFDGTLSPIVHDPFMAGLVDGADGALEALAERLAVVAIVTGRMPLDARRLVGVPGVLVVGNHGTEWLDPDQSEPTTAADADAVGQRARRGAGARAADAGRRCPTTRACRRRSTTARRPIRRLRDRPSSRLWATSSRSACGSGTGG